MKKFVIALDGPSGAGKSSVGQMIAKKYSMRYFQSSLIYRTLAYMCIQHGIKAEEVDQVIKLAPTIDYLKNNPEMNLNTEEVGNYTSKIAAIAEIREIANLQLRDIIKQNERIIMEGRDIGSVVAVNADVKIYLTANIRARAERRYKQLCLEGKECILSDILRLMQERDRRDQTRENAPLVIAKDALVIDSSDLTPEEVMLKIEQYIAIHNAGELL